MRNSISNALPFVEGRQPCKYVVNEVYHMAKFKKSQNIRLLGTANKDVLFLPIEIFRRKKVECETILRRNTHKELLTRFKIQLLATADGIKYKLGIYQTSLN